MEKTRFRQHMKPFDYQVVRSSRRRTASITVKPDCTVRVAVPAALTEDMVVELVERKSQWIQTKLSQFQAIRSNEQPRAYVSGEFFTYLGRDYRLNVCEDAASGSVKLKNGRFHVPVPSGLKGAARQSLIRERLSGWYQEHAAIQLRDKVQRYAEKMGVSPRSVGVKGYRSRWGTCHSDGRVYFNWRIIMAPHSVIDYLVVHELCHLVHGNHSKKFWKLVERVLPDYQEHREWLRMNGRRLSV